MLVLSLKAEKQLENLFEYLISKWSVRIQKKVAEKIYKNFKLIEVNCELFPKSNYNIDLHKCVVSKQTTIFYQVRKNEIVVISVFDTRQNPFKINK